MSSGEQVENFDIYAAGSLEDLIAIIIEVESLDFWGIPYVGLYVRECIHARINRNTVAHSLGLAIEDVPEEVWSAAYVQVYTSVISSGVNIQRFMREVRALVIIDWWLYGRPE